MTKASGTRLNWEWAVLLALILALLSGAVRAEPSPAAAWAWAFDLLERVEQWRPTLPLDFLRNPDFLPSLLGGEGSGVRGVQAGYGRLPMHFEPNSARPPTK